jgi:tetratricopeptide (TPR) repeat protein
LTSEIPATSTISELSLRLATLLGLVLTLALAAVWGSRPLIHDDLFFHLSTGDYVVENHEVPTTDSFSFTRVGEPWVSHEWGFGLLVYAAHAVGEDRGLVVLKSLLAVSIVALLFLLMFRMAGSQKGKFVVYLVPLLALGLWAIDDQLVLRPSLVSCLLLLLLLHLLLSFDRTGHWWTFGGIVGLFLLWANLHSEVLFGLFVLGLVTLEAVLGRASTLSGSTWGYLLRASPGRPYLRLFGISVVATLVNPNGIQVLLYPFRVVRFLSLGGMDLEMGHFTGATPESQPAFFLLLVLLLMALLPLREQLHRVSLTQAVSIGVFIVLSLSSHRFIFFFVLLTLPTMATLFQPAMQLLDDSKHYRLLRNLLRGAVLLVVGSAAVAGWRSLPEGSVSRHFPEGAVRFLQEEEVEGRIFNHQNYGGYLHWSLQQLIFWDGRALLFEPLMRQLPGTPLEEATAQWELTHLVITEHEFEDLAAQLTAERWGLVYWDDFAALYLRRLPRFGSLLERRELTVLPPFGGVTGLNLVAKDPIQAAAAREELNQVLELEPRSQRALYLIGLISYYRQEFQQAEEALEAAAAIGPNTYVLSALADLMEDTGRDEEAARLRRQAIDADSGPASDEE